MKKIVSILCFILLALCGLFYVIDFFSNGIDIFDLENGSLSFAVILTLLGGIVLLVTSLGMIYKCVACFEENEDTIGFSSIAFMFFIIMLVDVISSSIIVNEMNKLFENAGIGEIRMGTAYNVMVTLEIIGCIVFFISLLVSELFYRTSKQALITIGLICLLITIIICLAETNPQGISLVNWIFIMIAAVAGGITILCPVSSIKPKYTYRPVYRPNPTPAVQTVKTEENSVKKLKELKDLFDQGIISEEEYLEARKKYINKL